MICNCRECSNITVEAILTSPCLFFQQYHYLIKWRIRPNIVKAKIFATKMVYSHGVMRKYWNEFLFKGCKLCRTHRTMNKYIFISSVSVAYFIVCQLNQLICPGTMTKPECICSMPTMVARCICPDNPRWLSGEPFSITRQIIVTAIKWKIKPKRSNSDSLA